MATKKPAATWSYEGNEPHAIELESTREGIMCAGCGASAVDHYFTHTVPSALRVAGVIILPATHRVHIGGFDEAGDFGLNPEDIAALKRLTITGPLKTEALS